MISIRDIFKLPLTELLGNFNREKEFLDDNDAIVDLEFNFFDHIKEYISKFDTETFNQNDLNEIQELFDTNAKNVLEVLNIDIDPFNKKLKLASLIFDDNDYVTNLAYTPSDFSIIKVEGDLVPLKSFEHIDGANKQNCFLYINFKKIDWSSKELVENIGVHLLSTFLYLMFSDNSRDLEEAYILVTNLKDNVTKKNSVAALKLLAIMSGAKINTPKLSKRKLAYPYLTNVTIGSDYQQFNDVLYIAGEYNSHDEILSKYLSIYHIIENFMFRYPIVKLSNDTISNEMIGVREFKSLYKSTDINEADALKKLLKVCFDININGSGIKIENVIESYYKELDSLPRFSDKDCNALFKSLSIQKTYNKNEGVAGVKSLFPTLLYKVRCSIVHNKETEYHIINSKINETMQIVLDDFLMKSMEFIIFSLISKVNDIVWYKNQHLELYSS